MKKELLAVFAALVALSACGTGQDKTITTSSTPSTYTFTRLAGPTIWTQLERTLAVDNQNRAYVTSGTTIFRVDSNGPSVYLDADTIAAAIGGGANASTLNIRSIDIGPDNQVYILESWFRKILVSTGPGNVTVHRDLSGIGGFPRFIGVVDANNILMINLYDGMWSVRNTGNSLLYDKSLVLGGTNCGTEDLAVQQNGHFVYLPGCNSSPMISGMADGSGAGILLTDSIDVGLNSYWSFSGVGRDPSGGYIVNINGARILHTTTTGQYEMVDTQPLLDTLAVDMEGNDLAFFYSPIAMGPTGDIFILSATALYVAR